MYNPEWHQPVKETIFLALIYNVLFFKVFYHFNIYCCLTPTSVLRHCFMWSWFDDVTDFVVSWQSLECSVGAIGQKANTSIFCSVKQANYPDTRW